MNLDLQRERLLAQRADMVASVAALAVNDEHLAASRANGDARVRDMTEGDSLSVEAEVNARLTTSQREAVADIDRALARIAAGSYTTCEGCGGAIPGERLEARPRVRTCVPCASRR